MNSHQSAKEELKRAADIVELIGQFVQLKKAGQNHVGLCPFHSEKAPSFTVSPAKQMFHCFGCKKGGDVFAFWMEYHKVSFPQALRDLADRYHITLPEKQLTPSEKRKTELRELLFKINERAAEYFHHVLKKSEKGKPGIAYLGKRSIPEQIISEFRLGYAPDEWDGLIGFLKRAKVDMEKAVQAGLIIPKKNSGYYDRFRGRVIFPIFNLRQQIVGFGGRVLDDSLPKYLNSPETTIFHKSECLYGLHASHKPIRESNRAVVVEGYTDVLALKRHGFHEAVATLGTALTREHIRTLKGYANQAVVVFDSDAAGEAAAIKSLSFFLNEGLSARVMVLPEGDDPDSFVNKNGLNDFLDLLSGSIPMFDFYLDRKLAHMGDGVEGQVSVLKEILPVLSELKNAAQQSLYLKRLSQKTGITESAVSAELRNWQTYHSWKVDNDGLGERLSASKVKKIDDLHLLNLFVHYPQTIDRLMNLDYKVLLSDPVVIGIFESVEEICTGEEDIKPANILERLEGDSTKERFRETMLSAPIYPHDMVEQALNEFEAKIHRIRRSESINKAREQGDIEGLNQLLKSKGNRQGQTLQ
jgi:DNA primase